MMNGDVESQSLVFASILSELIPNPSAVHCCEGIILLLAICPSDGGH